LKPRRDNASTGVTAPRYHRRRRASSSEEKNVKRSSLVRRLVLLAVALTPCTSVLAQGTLERIQKRGEFRIGYRKDARPLSFEDNGQAAGYMVDVCRRIADAVKEHLQLAKMKLKYVPVTAENRFDAVAKGDVDIECGATTITMSRQERVDFSLMTFVTGGAILCRADHKIGPLADLAGKTVAVVRGTTTADALQAFLAKSLIDAHLVPVSDRGDGMARLERGDVDGFASDHVVLIGEARGALEKDKSLSFSFADELFSFEPIALMVRRNDGDFRLVVNSALAHMSRSGTLVELYRAWIASAGVDPSPLLVAMFQVQALSD
jgi:ABC-type amino acid transport substrate-binding protein